MEMWMWAVLVVAVLILLILLSRRKKPQQEFFEGEIEFQRAGRLLTPRERVFMDLLTEAVGEQFRVFPKVCLAELVRPADSEFVASAELPPAAAFSYVDYALCSSDDLAVIAAIRIKAKPEPVEGESVPDLDVIDDLLMAADISVTRFEPTEDYTPGEIQNHLAKSLSLPTKVFGQATHRLSEAAKPEEPKARETDGAPMCPACDAPMAHRRAKQGKFAGRLFWVCTRFPECKKVLPVKE